MVGWWMLEVGGGGGRKVERGREREETPASHHSHSHTHTLSHSSQHPPSLPFFLTHAHIHRRCSLQPLPSLPYTLAISTLFHSSSQHPPFLSHTQTLSSPPSINIHARYPLIHSLRYRGCSMVLVCVCLFVVVTHHTSFTAFSPPPLLFSFHC